MGVRRQVLIGTDQLNEFVNGYIHQVQSETLLQGYLVRLAGDKPVRRLSDDAEVLSIKELSGIMNLGQKSQTLSDVCGSTMDDLTLAALLIEV